MKLLNKITGRRYWYQIKLVYKTKELNQIFSNTTQIGLARKSNILKERYCKKVFAPLHKNKDIKIRRLLCNGVLSIETISYLGYIKKEVNNEHTNRQPRQSEA